MGLLSALYRSFRFKSFIAPTIAILSLTSATAHSETRVERIAKEVEQKGNLRIGLILRDLNSWKTLASYRENEFFMPASVQKLITTRASLWKLGTEYNFQTHFYFKDGTLAVKGGGDPGLTIDSLWMAARALRLRGVVGVRRILLDDSRWSETSGPSGERAYEAGSSALSFNFNSLGIVGCPFKQGVSVKLDPLEAGYNVVNQVRLQPGSIKDMQIQQTGTEIRVAGNLGRNADCQTVYRSSPETARYLGKTLAAYLRQLGIAENPKIEMTSVSDQSMPLIYTHLSRPLAELTRDMDRWSNNFMAEQLVFALGCSDGSENCSKAKGLAEIEHYLSSLEIGKDDHQIVDGSGLSRENRMSPKLLSEVLLDALSDMTSSVEFEMALPVAGLSGTLRHRNFDVGSATVRAKTGSLDGVSSLAGVVYFPNKKGVVFVFLANGGFGRDDAYAFERKLLEATVAQSQ